mmetsp:Transcript_5178/g.8383  ORF Transcript_5178/g.8383 Transcript_5178/m.8383 type:complete len:94 (-) Transcript_5178:690-971(-)
MFTLITTQLGHLSFANSLKNSSKPSHRLQQRRPILFVIIPVVAVGIGAFAAITVAQVVRNRLLEEAKLKEEAISTGSITGSEADKESKRQKDQ